MDELKRISDWSKAKHMLFLVDACYGGLAAMNTRSLSSTSPNYLDNITEDISRQIITAGGKEEQVVEKDELESRHRMILNYGHTLGHAIEALTHYKEYKHGEAIAIGMIFAAKLSADLGRCPKTVERQNTALVKRFSLPTRAPDIEPKALIQAMHHDKKTENKNIKFILTRGIGSIEIEDKVSEVTLKKSLDEFRYQEIED